MILGLNLNVIDWNSTVFVWILRLFVACLCGFAIGIERTARSKEAGLRTHTIVCFASALVMIISKYAFSDLVGDLAAGTRGADSARIAAQVVSGIGFLGAGIIFYKRDLLRGLTTAAGIWATAGIGLAVGSGMIITGVIATIILICIQLILHNTLKILHHRGLFLLKISTIIEDDTTIEKIRDAFKVRRLERVKTKNKDGVIYADLDVITDFDWSAQDIVNLTKSLPCIQSVERSED